MYKYAVQNLHRKQVHVNSVPRHCVPSEISTAMRDGTENRSTSGGGPIHARVPIQAHPQFS